MLESDITRRRILQGAGAVGVASLGSTVIAAQEQEGDGGDGQSAAIRVAHASPDAPNIDVRLNTMDGGGAAGDGNETGGVGNETNETGGQDGDGEDEGPQIGGLGFREVSSYNEIDPGTYQMEIVPAEGGLIEQFIKDLFGGGDDDERTVLFDDEVEVEAGTTYTVVAFGEVARGPIPAEGAEMDGMAGNETNATQNETDGIGTDGNETDGGMAGNETNATQNETDDVGGDATTAGGDELVSELAFGEHETVDLDAGDYTLEIREAGAASMDDETGVDMDGNETAGNETNATQNETDGIGTDGNETDGVGANETNATTDGGASAQTGDAEGGFQVQVLEDDVTAPGEEQARLRIFHAVPDVESVSISQVAEETPGGDGGAGANDTGVDQNDTGVDQNDTGGGAGQQENDTGAGGGGGPQQEEGVRQAQISPAGNTVYSGFALGYFDPQAAASAGDGGGDANMTGDDNATGDGNETGNATDEEVAEDAEGEEFELVTVEDAQGGERSDGGTGGLFSLAPPADQ